MRKITLIIVAILTVHIFGQPLKGKPRILLPRGAVWVERGLHATLGLGQTRQWGNGEFLYINEGGGFAYSPFITGSVTVSLMGGIYQQKKLLDPPPSNGNLPDSLDEKRIFVSEKYGMNAKFHFVSDNKKRALYIATHLELDNASNSSLETSREVSAKTDSISGKLIGRDNEVIEREFVASKDWMIGLELGYGERYRNYWGFSTSFTAKMNPFEADYGNLVSFGEDGTGIPIWDAAGTIGVSIDLIEIWPGLTESLNALFIYFDNSVNYDGTILNYTFYVGSSMAF